MKLLYKCKFIYYVLIYMYKHIKMHHYLLNTLGEKIIDMFKHADKTVVSTSQKKHSI